MTRVEDRGRVAMTTGAVTTAEEPDGEAIMTNDSNMAAMAQNKRENNSREANRAKTKKKSVENQEKRGKELLLSFDSTKAHR